jgi:hypothetical protein
LGSIHSAGRAQAECRTALEFPDAARRPPDLGRPVIGIACEQILRCRYGVRIIRAVDFIRLDDMVLGIEHIATISNHEFPQSGRCSVLTKQIKS